MNAVSAVIISFNSADALPACVHALHGTGAEVIVVDNASTDGSAGVAAELGVRVLANGRNAGFAGAANQGARAAYGEFILFLNPDAVLESGFDALRQALENDKTAGAAAGLLVGADGEPQTGFNFRALPTFTALAFEVLLVNRLWPRNPVNRRYRCFDVAPDVSEVEQPAGACLMVRRTALEQVGWWDERFHPVWFEDVDLCLRLRRAGYRILFCPHSRWLHRGGHSVQCIPFARKQLFWYGNLLRYVRKHMGLAAASAMRILIAIGAAARLVGSTFSTAGPRDSGAWWAVLKLALGGKDSPSATK